MEYYSASKKWVVFYCVCVCVCICHIFFIRSSVDGRMGYFHVLTIENNAALDTGVYVSF